MEAEGTPVCLPLQDLGRRQVIGKSDAGVVLLRAANGLVDVILWRPGVTTSAMRLVWSPLSRLCWGHGRWVGSG